MESNLYHCFNNNLNYHISGENKNQTEKEGIQNPFNFYSNFHYNINPCVKMYSETSYYSNAKEVEEFSKLFSNKNLNSNSNCLFHYNFEKKASPLILKSKLKLKLQSKSKFKLNLKEIRFENNESINCKNILKLNKIRKRNASSKMNQRRSNASFLKRKIIINPTRRCQENSKKKNLEKCDKMENIEKMYKKQNVHTKNKIKIFNFENLFFENANDPRIKMESKKRNVPLNFMRHANICPPTNNDLASPEASIFKYKDRALTAINNIGNSNNNYKVNNTFVIKKKEIDEIFQKGCRNVFYNSFNISKIQSNSHYIRKPMKYNTKTDFSSNINFQKKNLYSSNVQISRRVENQESNNE